MEGKNRFKWIVTHGKVVGTLASIALAIVLGFLPPDRSLPTKWFESTGFYFIFLSFLMWVVTLLPTPLSWPQTTRALRKNTIAFLLAALLTVIAFRACPPNFRILADETNMVGMSMAMYDHKSFYNPTQGRNYYDNYWEISHTWDKRPLFYPFLLYLAHTFLGYSGYNGFWVNAVAGFFCFVTFYWLMRRRFQEYEALSGMILLASFPVLIIWITSSGYEVTNLAFILLSFLFLDRFLAERTVSSAERLGLTLVLLAQCRYESALFSLIFIPVVCFSLPREAFKELTLRSMVMPLLYLPVIWQRLHFEHSYQLGEGEAAFGFSYFVKHAGLAVDYFASNMEQHGSNPLIFFMAFMGLVVFLSKRVVRRQLHETRNPAMALTILLSLIFEGVVIFAYYWGDITRQYSVRLSIVFLPLIAFLAIYFLNRASGFLRVPWQYVLLLCVGTLMFAMPVAGKNKAVKEILTAREYLRSLEFLESKFPDRNIVVVSHRSGMYAVHRWGAVDFDYANANEATLLMQLKNRLFQEIVVIQYVSYGNHQPLANMALNPGYSLEPLHRTQIDGSEYLRISRVVLQ